MWQSTGIVGVANALGFALTLAFPHTHYHVDLLGTGAFALAALPSFMSSSLPRIRCSAAAVILWSVKLAGYLLQRVLQSKHDARLDAQLSNPVSAAGFWWVSFLWGVVVSLPHTLGTTSSLAPGHDAPWTLCTGLALFGVGWITETLADYQKWTFKQQNPVNRFCNAGLWSVVQHPNWLGNLLLWSGILLINAPALVEPTFRTSLWQSIWSVRRLALALLGPGFLWILFEAQATGKIFDETRQANLKKYGYGADLIYTKYIDNTPWILPSPVQLWLNMSDVNKHH